MRQVLNPFSSLMTSLFGLFLSLDPAGITSYCTDLRVQVNLLGVLFITVDVEPDGCSGAACTAETENNSRTIREDDPKALTERDRRREALKNKTVTHVRLE